MNDDSVNSRQWGAAIYRWLDGDRTALRPLIFDNSVVQPDFARHFLADLAEGKVNRGKGGRPAERYGGLERAIVAEVFSEWGKAAALPISQRGASTPKDLAIEAVAERRKDSADAIRGVVDKLQKLGITRQAWQSWGSPEWKSR